MLKNLTAFGVHLHDQALAELRQRAEPTSACDIAEELAVRLLQAGEEVEFGCDDVFDVLLYLREEGLVNFTFPLEGPRLRPNYTWFALPADAAVRGRHHLPGT